MASLRRSGRKTLRIRFAALSASAIILLVLAARFAIVIAGGLGPTAVEGPARTIPNTDVNPYGANFFLDREVEPWKLDKTLQMASQGGIGWVKQQFTWEEVEPTRKGEFLEPATKSSSWGKFDAIVDSVRQVRPAHHCPPRSPPGLDPHRTTPTKNARRITWKTMATMSTSS